MKLTERHRRLRWCRIQVRSLLDDDADLRREFPLMQTDQICRVEAHAFGFRRGPPAEQNFDCFMHWLIRLLFSIIFLPWTGCEAARRLLCSALSHLVALFEHIL